MRLVVVALLICGCSKEPVTANLTPDGPGQFSAERAFEDVRRLVSFGPRTPGSEGIRKAQQYIISELQAAGLSVVQDDFTAQTPRGPLAMKNIVGVKPGKRSETVIIAGHYDTKVLPGFVGANDGGSSTAAVLELARVLRNQNLDFTIWFVFFDGEEAQIDWNANDGKDNTYGSRHMVERLKADGGLALIRAMVLVDMIGDNDLDLMRDMESTPWLVDLIWNTARRIGHGRHFLPYEAAYADDHVPFLRAGVPAIDIIDFNFGPDNSYWHTTEDTLDKVSGASMKVVGDVVLAALPELFKKLDEKPSVGPRE